MAISLLLLLVATVFMASFLTSTGQASASVASKLRRQQARYLAEAAIRLQVWCLSAPPQDTLGAAPQAPPAGLEAPTVQVDSSDFWLRMVGRGTQKEQSVSIVAELGKPRNPEAFRYALRLLDPIDPVKASSIRAVGPVYLSGPPSASSEAKFATPSSSQLLEQVLRIPERHWLHWLEVRRAMFDPDSLLHCEDSCVRGNVRFWRASDLPASKRLVVGNGNLSVDLGTSSSGLVRIPGRRTWVVQGAVSVRGDIAFDTLEIVADGAVRIAGNVSAARLSVFSQDRIDVEGQGRFEARLLAQGDIRIAGKTELLPWSFVVTNRTAGTPGAGRGDIQVLDEASVTGFLVCASSSQAPPAPPMTGSVGVLVDGGARVKGAVFSVGSVQNQGFIGGTVTTRRLACVGGDASANCPDAGIMDRDSLPEGLLQPFELDFGESVRFSAVRWGEP